MSRLIRGRYETVGVTARGGGGEVLEAVDHLHGRRVALKARRVHAAGRVAVVQEADVLRSITPHAGLPLVRDAFITGTRHYLVMDWIEGPDLAALLAERGAPGLPLSSVLAHLEQVAAALDHLHGHDPPVVHGDVRPSNIIVTPGRGAVLVGFGASEATPASDVYALAATAFTLLMGSPPVPGVPVADDLPEALRAGLEPDAGRRPPSAGALVEALGGRPVGAALPSGTLTFLFTDIEGSTVLAGRLGDEYAALLEAHRKLLRTVVPPLGGREFGTEGDAMLFAFQRATHAIRAALEAQFALAAHAWPGVEQVRVRMGLHTGEAVVSSGDYVGVSVHHAARVASAGHGEQILLSSATRELVSTALPQETSLRDLGLYRLKDLPGPQPLFQLTHPDLLDDHPPLRAEPVWLHNLPADVTSFVGREREADELVERLRSHRLVTVTGAGGSGKSRLATRVASELLASYPDGVWWVELGAVGDPALVPQAAAVAAGVEARPQRDPLDLLAEQLRRSRTLLVLDNCEHLAEACAQLASELLSSCAGLTILATSRERLAVPGEAVYPLSTLDYDDAIRLFVERACQHEPRFGLDGDNALVVAEVCRRLDGIPLAIELAAARVRALSPSEIAARLDDRFRLLAAGARTAPPRQQTLRATLDWSHDLLSAEEAALFRRCAVFVGGFSLEAAEDVCADSEAVFDTLARLVDRSLVGASAREGRTRYSMLETVRAYAQERLAESGEEDEIAARHHRWFTTLAKRAEGELTGPEQAGWLEVLETEHDNLRAAVARSLAARDPTALELTSALTRFWAARGYWSEGRRHLEAALARASWGAGIVALAHLGAGHLAERERSYADAVAHYEESLRLSRTAHDDHGVAGALNRIGEVARLRGDHVTARARYEEALALMRRVDDRRGVAQVLINRGALGFALADAGGAEADYTEALALVRELGDELNVALTLSNLGQLAQSRGDPHRARTLLEEALAKFRALGGKVGAADALQNLGLAAAGHGESSAAIAYMEESLALRRELGDTPRVAYLLFNLGLLYEDAKDLPRSIACYQESRGLVRELAEEKRTRADLLFKLASAGERLGDDDTASACFAEYIELLRDLDEPAELAVGLEALAGVAARTGDGRRARALLSEALAAHAELRDRAGLARCVAGLARLASTDGRLGEAARLYGAAAAVAPPEDWMEKGAAAVRAALGARDFADAWAEGQSAGVEGVPRWERQGA